MVNNPRRRLLILDDDPLVGLLVQTVAQFAGADAVKCDEHAQFFEALPRWQPTHIYLDLMMPIMSGEQVLERLASQCCTADIVIASGLTNERVAAVAAKARAAGLRVLGTLQKPFSPSDLRSLLERGTASGPPVPT
jgi:CheY-like chemotaxis protein